MARARTKPRGTPTRKGTKKIGRSSVSTRVLSDSEARRQSRQRALRRNKRKDLQRSQSAKKAARTTYKTRERSEAAKNSWKMRKIKYKRNNGFTRAGKSALGKRKR